MRQIQLPPRPDEMGIDVPDSWRPWDPIHIEPLFMVAAKPEDLEVRFGIRFQETWEDGLGRVQVALVALPSGREIFWHYALNPNFPECGCIAFVRQCDYVAADLTEEVVPLLGRDQGVIQWRQPTSWPWPDPQRTCSGHAPTNP